MRLVVIQAFARQQLEVPQFYCGNVLKNTRLGGVAECAILDDNVVDFRFWQADEIERALKTAGTSYLEALRVVAKHDELLFRRVIEVARRYYDRDKATYHLSADVSKLPKPEDTADVVELEKAYLERWCDVPAGKGFTAPGRQVLHCTFGTILMDPELGVSIRQLLEAHTDTYTEVLADHFARHLRALDRGAA